MTEAMTITKEDLERLGAKLDRLELTDADRAVLVAVFTAAGRDLGGAEVEGHAWFMRPGFTDALSQLFPPGTRVMSPNIDPTTHSLGGPDT